jgi:UDP-N-acetylmuramate dehydrogenase
MSHFSGEDQMVIEQLQRNVSLRNKNTLRLDVRSKYYIEIASACELERLVLNESFPTGKVLVLGGGSNIVFAKDFQGLVVKINIKGIDVFYEDDEFVHVEIGAGENWASFVEYAVSNGWGGIENLAMVPGTAGAAPIQNIACYGHNLHESLLSVDAIMLSTGARKTFSVEQCNFGYRTSIFKQDLSGEAAIVNIKLRLRKKPQLNTSYRSRYESVENELASIKSPPYNVQDVYQAIVNIRRRKLPNIENVGTVGSVFKNPLITRDQLETIRGVCPDIQYYPQTHLIYDAIADNDKNERVKVPAAWLIEEMGWAGKRIGNCGIWKTQPLNIVNYGNATPEEFLSVINMIREAVYDRYSIMLETEVVVV